MRDLSAGLVPIGVASDGLVEAISMNRPSFVLGVQWHPELMFRRDPAHLRGFQAFIAAADAFAHARQDRVVVSV
ncbi:MAG: gamma-glutamyl-gamma-aminobutyrate hydrolase family protein [Thermomicrobiales bacterium]